MKQKRAILTDSSGFVLATIIVFIVVLTLTGYLVANMTRTDVQVVHNIAREKEAFFRAEAGVTEGLLRIDWEGGNVTVDGDTFDPKITPVETDPAWKAFVVFDGSLTGPVTSGSVVTAPTIQRSADGIMPYSTETVPAVCTSGVTWARDACEALQFYWEPDGSGGIATTATGRKILNLVSTGQAGKARRRVEVVMTKELGTQQLQLSDSACPGFEIVGTKTVSFDGGMHMNATCDGRRDAGLTLGNNANVSGDSLDVVGGYVGPDDVDADVQTGADPIPDPFAGIPPPTVPADDTGCDHTNYQAAAGSTLSPGVYCNGLKLSTNNGTNVTLDPGIYKIMGGTLEVTGAGDYSAPGVMFYVTEYPGNPPGDWANVLLGPNGNLDFRAPTAAELEAAGETAQAAANYSGFLFFQERGNDEDFIIKGSFQDGLAGLIYAPDASFEVQNAPGSTPRDLDLELVVGSLSFTGDTHFGVPTPCRLCLALPGEDFDVAAWSD